MSRVICFARRFIVCIVISCLLCAVASPASAATYTAPNPLLPYVNSQIPNLDNSSFPYVVKPTKYASSPRYRKTPYKEKANTIAPGTAIGLSDTYKTTLFLPLRFSAGAAYNPQSIVIVGKYIYVLYSKGATTNKGFIVRYDQNLMKKYGLTSGSGMVKLRAAAAGQLAPASLTKKTNSLIKKAEKKLKKKKTKKAEKKRLKKRLKTLKKKRTALKKKTAEQNKIKKVYKVGPTFTVGHGQSLAYNPVRNELWMWRDMHNANGTWQTPEKSVLQRVSMSTLRDDAIVRFYMTNGVDNTPVSGTHTLAFDSRGNAYFWRSGDTLNKVYRMQLTPTSVKVELVQHFTRRPGSNGQSLSYNATTDRLYFVADDAIMTASVSKLGALALGDMTSTTYSSKREFEGLAFDAQGYGYLLLNQGPEVLRTTRPSK